MGGQVLSEGNFVAGEEDGKHFFYDEDGNITDEDIYKDGECVEMCEGADKVATRPTITIDLSEQNFTLSDERRKLYERDYSRRCSTCF